MWFTEIQKHKSTQQKNSSPRRESQKQIFDGLWEPSNKISQHQQAEKYQIFTGLNKIWIKIFNRKFFQLNARSTISVISNRVFEILCQIIVNSCKKLKDYINNKIVIIKAPQQSSSHILYVSNDDAEKGRNFDDLMRHLPSQLTNKNLPT